MHIPLCEPKYSLALQCVKCNRYGMENTYLRLVFITFVFALLILFALLCFVRAGYIAHKKELFAVRKMYFLLLQAVFGSIIRSAAAGYAENESRYPGFIKV